MASVDSPVQLKIPPEGRLGIYSISWLLSALGQLDATCVLTFTRSKLTRKIVLEDGKIRTVLSNAREDRLFDWLVSNEKIDASTLPAHIVEKVEQAPMTGAFLLATGLIDSEQLSCLMQDHLVELLDETSEWKDCRYEITPGRVDLGQEPVLDLNAFRLSLDIARTLASNGRPSVLPGILVARANPDRVTGLPLDEVEKDVLEKCAEPIERVNLFEVLSKQGTTRVQTALETFWRMGLIAEGFFQAKANTEEAIEVESVTRSELERWLRAAENEQLELLLGVGENADAAEVRKAYYRIVRRFHPDRFLQGPLASFHGQIEQAMRIVHEALKVLSDPAERRAWERRRREKKRTSMDPNQVADQYVAQAKAHAKGSRRSDAVYSLEQAVKRAPQHFAARFGLAILLAGNPRRRSESVKMFEALVKENSGKADVHAAFGLALEKSGDTAGAEREFERALSLDAGQAIVLGHRGDPEALKRARQDPLIALLLR